MSKTNKEIISIKSDEEDNLICEYDIDEVWNLTQVLAELEIMRLHIVKEYIDRTKMGEKGE